MRKIGFPVGCGAHPTASEAGALPETGRYRANLPQSTRKQILVSGILAAASYKFQARDHLLGKDASLPRHLHFQLRISIHG